MQEQRKTAKATTSEMILEALREQIINGTLVPQEKLVEAEIAQQFGTSRGPVRDALKQLAMEGMVDYQPNKGCSVTLLSPEDAYEVFFLRGSLEKLAIQKSNCHVSDYGLLIMETSIEEFRIADEAGNLMQAVRADEKFHQPNCPVCTDRQADQDVGAFKPAQRCDVPFRAKRQPIRQSDQRL